MPPLSAHVALDMDKLDQTHRVIYVINKEVLVIVEFTGSTGVGKSSCLAQTARVLEYAGVRVGVVGHPANSIHEIPDVFAIMEAHNWKMICGRYLGRSYFCSLIPVTLGSFFAQSSRLIHTAVRLRARFSASLGFIVI